MHLHRVTTLANHYTTILCDGDRTWWYDGLSAAPHVVPLENIEFDSHSPQHCLYVLE